MIVCNGSPKTGTHLLLKAVYLFGGVGFSASHAHKSFGCRILGKHLHIKRNPRNVLLSWVRFSGNELKTHNIISEIDHIIKEMTTYKGWLDDGETLNVSFELLLSDKKELERVSGFLGLPLVDDHFSLLWGGTRTFTNNLIKWKDHWNDEINEVWVKAGGLELEKDFGYNHLTDKEVIRIV